MIIFSPHQTNAFVLSRKTEARKLHLSLSHSHVVIRKNVNTRDSNMHLIKSICMQISSCYTNHRNSSLTVETVGIAPPVPAAVWVNNINRNCLWVDYDDVVQFSNLVVARGSSEQISDIPSEHMRDTDGLNSQQILCAS